MKITSLDLVRVYTTREMGNTNPSDPVGATSYHVVVKLYTDTSITGIGEMSDIDFARDKRFVTKLQSRLEERLAGQDASAVVSIMSGLKSEQWEHQVLCGIETALYDAVGKVLDVPMYQLLGGKIRDKIRFSYPLSSAKVAADVDANLNRIEHRLAQGHDCFRYYFGANLDLDEEFLAEMRRRWGDDVEINALDASGRFTVEEAIVAIDRLVPYKANVVESPVKGRHNAPVEDFLAVKETVDIPIGEHVSSFDVAARLAAHNAIDVWNIGAGYSGISDCVKTFATAEVFGAKTLHGSTVEMSIGTAARVHIMAAVPNLDLPCYPSGPLVYHEDVVRERVQYENGYVVVPDGPGLGVEIDEANLNAQRL